MQLTLKYRFRNKKPMYFAKKKNFALENVSLHLNMFLKLLPKRIFWLQKLQNEI
jgi:hypothetical protein